MAGGGKPPRSRAKRLGWFVGLWVAGVVAVVVLAYAIRFIIGV
ncbi:MAG: DUF2474 domain-containing protein [Gammaproteobacteria bacterium]|nr:DUF2474 domain-containing protein [Gammaproteobacteria bacterium]